MGEEGGGRFWGLESERDIHRWYWDNRVGVGAMEWNGMITVMVKAVGGIKSMAIYPMVHHHEIIHSDEF